MNITGPGEFSQDLYSFLSRLILVYSFDFDGILQLIGQNLDLNKNDQFEMSKPLLVEVGIFDLML